MSGASVGGFCAAVMWRLGFVAVYTMALCLLLLAVFGTVNTQPQGY